MKKLLLMAMVLILIGCQLDKLHPITDDLCESFDIVVGLDNYGDGRASDIISVDNNEYVICGSTNNSTTFLMKIDSDDNESFLESQSFPNAGNYTANSVVQLQDGSGGYLICGNVETNTNGVEPDEQALFVQCDFNGKLIDYTLGEIGTHCEYIAYENGKYVFTGNKEEDIYVGTVDVSPNLIISKRYTANNTGNQKVYAVQKINSNEYLFAGHSVIDGGVAIPYVFRLDTELNTFSECAQYANPQGIDEIYITCMTDREGGSYMLAGYLRESQDAPLNAFMLKINNDCTYGNLHRINSNENVEIYGITEVDNGNYLICGNKKSEMNNSRYAYALKLNGVGDMLNDYSYGENTTTDERIANVAIGEGDCNYMMAGYNEGTDDNSLYDNKILVVKIN